MDRRTEEQYSVCRSPMLLCHTENTSRCTTSFVAQKKKKKKINVYGSDLSFSFLLLRLFIGKNTAAKQKIIQILKTSTRQKKIKSKRNLSLLLMNRCLY